jgi:alpha-1,3-rhamnosyl/mannosyltransferase
MPWAPSGAARAEPVQVVLDGRTITDHFPGIGRYVYRLTEALAAAAPQDRFTILCTPGQSDHRFDLAALEQAANVRLRPVAAPVFSAASQWRVPAALRRAAADVFHATYWVTPWRPGRPTVLSVYDLIGLQPGGGVAPHRRLALALSLRLALGSAREVLTISGWSRDTLLARYPWLAGRLTVTHLAPDPAFRPPDPAAVAAARRALGLAERYVLSVGIDKPHKNLATLVAAWAAADARLGPERGAQLVLAGPRDPRYRALDDLIAGLGRPDRVRRLGPVPEALLGPLYGGAAVFAFPSRYEGFGLPPLEAMACGAPVLAARASSLPEVVGDAGLLVDPDDVAGWAGALERLLVEPGLAEALSARAVERAGRFTWRATAEATLPAYRRAAGGAGARG